MLGFDTPVMRAVERIELPSTSAATTAKCSCVARGERLDETPDQYANRQHGEHGQRELRSLGLKHGLDLQPKLTTLDRIGKSEN